MTNRSIHIVKILRYGRRVYLRDILRRWVTNIGEREDSISRVIGVMSDIILSSEDTNGSILGFASIDVSSSTVGSAQSNLSQFRSSFHIFR